MSSGAERVIASGFDQPGNYRSAFSGIWAVERTGGENLALETTWDEVHDLIHQPDQLSRFQSVLENHLYVLQPTTLDVQKWVSKLSQFSNEELNAKVFLEFFPWDSIRAEAPTVHEVSQFLQALKFHFPEWTLRRRPGVEMWDSRIDSDLELEASNFHQEIFNECPETPDISVIIPTFNNKLFVYNVLRHLARQNFSNKKFEVVLVDDGGTDETLNYIKTFGVPKSLQLKFAYWPRRCPKNKERSFFRAGLSRNLGVRLSRAERLVFLDSDILVSENFLQKVFDHLQTADVLQFPRHHIVQEKSHSLTDYRKVSPGDLYIEESHYWEPFFHSQSWMSLDYFWKYTCTYALALRKQDFYDAGRFRRFYISYGFEDTELGYTLAKMQKKFQLVPETVYHLTSYSQSQYQLSQIKRQLLLKKTAKQFFLSTLDLETYHNLRGFMIGDSAFWPRIKNRFGSTDKTKNRDVSSLAFGADQVVVSNLTKASSDERLFHRASE